MEFRVLGPLAVTHAGEGARLTGGLRRRLLAALLVNAGTVVPADRLIHLLWGDDVPASAAHNLHNQVSRVRAALDECLPGAAALLVTQPPGYLLLAGAEAIDAGRFELALADAVAESAVRPEYAVARLTEALALWRGPAFAEFADEEFCRYEAIRLEELRLVAVEELFEARLALGQRAELIGELEAFAAEHPFRERPRGLLMTALHRSGRQADALAVFREFRQLLAEQLGLDPSPALRRRHEHLLRDDPDAAEPPARPAGNLRLELNELVGRDEDLAVALDTLTRARVTTLTGVGGVGKTRFAARVAAQARARFPHGVWMCELGAVRDGGLVPDVLATTLGMQQPQGLSVTDGLVDFLRSRRTLLVVDNCEHVLDDAARLVDALAGSCPGVTVLATSREPLGVDGEHVLPVRPLAVPPPFEHDLDSLAAVPSVQLFVNRARAAVPEFALGTHNAGAVTEICRRLDGLPLAIELAVTRLRSMSVHEIAGRLEQRLHFLHSPRPAREDRHGTLAAVVDWSCDLLAPLERTVFDRLSVLVGSFTLDDAVALASDEEISTIAAVDAVTDLVRKSMLAADTDRAASRYTMLETLRIYGQERLSRAGLLEAARRRHAAHCVAVAEASATGLVGPDEAWWADRIAGLLDDLRGAHSWALASDPATAIRLSAALLRYTAAHGPSEVYGWADRAAALSEEGGPHLAITLAVAAAGAARRGDLAGATALALRGLAAVPGLEDPERRHALWVLARVASFEGRLADAEDLYRQVAEFAEGVGDRYSVAYVTASRALQYAYQGRTARAILLAREAKELAATTLNPTAIAWADYALGVALQDHEPEGALAALEQARTIGTAGGNTYIPGVALSVAASVMVRHGDPYRAVSLTAEVIGYWSHESHWAQQWVALRTAVVLLTRHGQDDAAAALHGALRASRAAIPPVGAEAERLNAAVAELTSRMGADRFAAATARGAALSDDDAVAFARTALKRIDHARLPDRGRLSC
jgi:predicted ATPase/DNA-binding SARP family transcriptional activator